MSQNTSPPVGRRLATLLLEVIAIVFGVLLGLGANEWQEDRERAAFVAESREVMLDELAANYALLIRSRQYHLDLLEPIIAARNALRRGEPPPPFDYVGFRAAVTTRAAYDTALNASVFAYIDPHDAREIANAYRLIDNVKAQDDRYKLALAMSTGGRFLEVLPLAFGDLLWSEDAALQAIAPLVGESAPPYWTDETETRPY